MNFEFLKKKKTRKKPQKPSKFIEVVQVKDHDFKIMNYTYQKH